MNTAAKVVQLFYERLAQSDMAGALALLTDDAELIQADSLPYGGRYIGHTGIRDFFSRFFTCWQQFRSEEVTYFSAENQVVVTSVAYGLTSQSQPVSMPMVQVYTLSNDKICHVRPFYFDTARLFFDG